MTVPFHANPQGTQHAAAEHTQYLSFMLGGEMFGIGILIIKEIIGFCELTTVPLMPETIRGVINLRGVVVPVLDLAVRFGRPASGITRRSCIVIVDIAIDGEHQVLGVLVDSVSAVLDIAGADIEPAPAFGANLPSAFIAGMGKVNGKFVILLDAACVLALEADGCPRDPSDGTSA